MTHETLNNTIRSRFKTLIGDVQGVTVIYDNDPTSIPEDVKWIRLSILPGASSQVSLGNVKRFRTVGVMTAQLFFPLNDGDKEINILADAIVSAFRSVTASGVTYKIPSVVRMGRQGPWWQINVDCPFSADTLA